LVGHLLEVVAGQVGWWSDRVGQPTGRATNAARQPAAIAPATSEQRDRQPQLSDRHVEGAGGAERRR
jgi:hypothetical protein